MGSSYCTGGRHVARLLLTGVPGWLTQAFLESFERRPIPGISHVRALVQPGHEHAQLGVDAVPGDLRDDQSLLSALSGVDLVLHAAGVLHPRTTSEWYDVNTRGTQNLVDAAAGAGVRRFVFISSNAAAGRGARPDDLLTE